ncbi:hypothetical protein [Flavobacterium dankookense]|nr:hypothetical protein [Flavobacterium dankookense]
MEEVKSKITFDFVSRTLKFCAVGLFIPGFSAILLFGIQMALTKLGIECTDAWKLIWFITWVGMLLTPTFFIKYLKSENWRERRLLSRKLILFNSLEYIFIQASFGSLMSNSETLCYGSGGQNGLELGFSAWLSLPILLAFSFAFNNIWKSKE